MKYANNVQVSGAIRHFKGAVNVQPEPEWMTTIMMH